MDRSAVGHDYVAKVQMHASQTDYRTGFGGKFGVQSDRIDKVIIIYFYPFILYTYHENAGFDEIIRPRRLIYMNFSVHGGKPQCIVKSK